MGCGAHPPVYSSSHTPLSSGDSAGCAVGFCVSSLSTNSLISARLAESAAPLRPLPTESCVMRSLLRTSSPAEALVALSTSAMRKPRGKRAAAGEAERREGAADTAPRAAAPDQCARSAGVGGAKASAAIGPIAMTSSVSRSISPALGAWACSRESLPPTNLPSSWVERDSVRAK